MIKKMKVSRFFAAVLAAVAAVSCKSQYDIVLNSSDVNLKYDAAMA